VGFKAITQVLGGFDRFSSVSISENYGSKSTMALNSLLFLGHHFGSRNAKVDQGL